MSAKTNGKFGIKKIVALIFVIALVFTALLGLFIRNANSAGSATQYPLNIKDASGYTLNISRAPSRIISMNPATTEMIFAAGYGDKLVGVTTYCDYPEAAMKIAKIGDINVNVEAIVALRPDIIIGMQDLQPEILLRLRNLGLQVLIIDASSTNNILKEMDTIGIVCGNNDQVSKVITDIRNRLEVVRRRTAGLAKPKVFIEIWNDPIMTAGRNTFIDEIVTLAGGNNIASSIDGWPVVSNEFVIFSNPDIILLTCYNKQEVMARRTWQLVTAVAKNQVYEVDANIASRNGPRFIDAVEQYADIFHPR